MSSDVRWPREAWIPLLAGLYWLWRAPEHGLLGFLFSVLPGCLLLGSGFAMLLMPGDRRIAQFAALGGVLGVVFALPAFVVVGPAAALLLIAASLAGFVAAGCAQRAPRAEGGRRAAGGVLVPARRRGRGRRGVAQHDVPDRAAAARGRSRAHPARDRRGARPLRVRRLAREARRLPRDAAGSSTLPALPARARATSTTSTCASRAATSRAPGEPGRERWLARAANRTAHAWVLRHAGPPRPWLVCIHGYQMGCAADRSARLPARDGFHRRLGLNLLVPTLPLHGPRKIGRRSGDGFLAGDLLDTLHAEAAGDVGSAPSARLAARRPGRCADRRAADSRSAATTPRCSPRSTPDSRARSPAFRSRISRARYYRHLPPLHVAERRAPRARRRRLLRDMLRVVSPLALEPQIPRERRWIFARRRRPARARRSGARSLGALGAAADRLVPGQPSHASACTRACPSSSLTALVDSGLPADPGRSVSRRAIASRMRACAARSSG